MNPFRTNNNAMRLVMTAMYERFGINKREIFKQVENINPDNNVITLKDGRRYEFTLNELG